VNWSRHVNGKHGPGCDPGYDPHRGTNHWAGHWAGNDPNQNTRCNSDNDSIKDSSYEGEAWYGFRYLPPSQVRAAYRALEVMGEEHEPSFRVLRPPPVIGVMPVGGMDEGIEEERFDRSPISQAGLTQLLRRITQAFG
jgi:hypothetical protein